MYAVIRAGGKQYRVAPGDVIRIERTPAADGERKIEFHEVLAVSAGEGQIGRPQTQARVVGTVVEEGRGDKVLVFHYKRKKQYKKLRGHRQPFTAVRITEIAFDGQKFTAPEQPAKAAKPRPAEPVSAAAPEAAGQAAPAREAKPHAAARSKSAGAARKPAAKRAGGASKKGKK